MAREAPDDCTALQPPPPSPWSSGGSEERVAASDSSVAAAASALAPPSSPVPRGGITVKSGAETGERADRFSPVESPFRRVILGRFSAHFQHDDDRALPVTTEILMPT